jgi:hypothetical protein
MWKLYSTAGYGIAIESTEDRLRNSVLNAESLVVDDVRYVDFDNDQIEKGHKHYGLFLKRKSFEHEKEFRATILLKQPGKGSFVECNLDTLIASVHVSPFAPHYLTGVVQNICSGSIRRLSKRVLRSPLFDRPDNNYGLDLRITL